MPCNNPFNGIRPRGKLLRELERDAPRKSISTDRQAQAWKVASKGEHSCESLSSRSQSMVPVATQIARKPIEESRRESRSRVEAEAQCDELRRERARRQCPAGRLAVEPTLTVLHRGALWVDLVGYLGLSSVSARRQERGKLSSKWSDRLMLLASNSTERGE